MARETAAHARELERLRAELASKNDAEIETLKRQLDVAVSSHLRELQDKVTIYRATADMIADLFTLFDRAIANGGPPEDLPVHIDKFNRERMRIYGYLAMLAPQSVMDRYDELVDFLINIIGGEENYEWPQVRRRVLGMINEIRRDIGLNKDSIEYRGKL